MSFTKQLYSRKFFLVNLVLVGIMIGFVAAFAVLAGKPSDNASAVALAESPRPAIDQASALAQAQAVQSAFNSVASTVLPSVVELDVIGGSDGGAQGQSPWRFFFGDPEATPDEREESPEYQSESLGSGIIVRKAGSTVYVLTNYHVVEGAKTISVKLYDEREYEGALVGSDTRKDLALVSFKAKIEDIPVAVLGNSDSVKVGDWAIAIGSPFGLVSSVSAGIVSAIGRDGGPDGNINDFIQTDAAINRGNSGGALVNIQGQIIGINTWIASTTGGSVGLGFSIPINNAVKVIDDLIERGTVRYGWLGVLLTAPDKPTATELGIAEQKGAFLGHVFTDGPGAKGGLRSGDLVTAIDGKPIANLDQLVRVVADLPVGKSVVFTVLRGAKSLQLKVVIEERKEAVAADYSKLWPGVEIAALSADEAAKLSIPKGVKGFKVISVIARSPASAASLRLGDVITEVNGTALKDASDFYRMINEAGKIQLTVYRNGAKLAALALARN